MTIDPAAFREYLERSIQEVAALRALLGDHPLESANGRRIRMELIRRLHDLIIDVADAETLPAWDMPTEDQAGLANEARTHLHALLATMQDDRDERRLLSLAAVDQIEIESELDDKNGTEDEIVGLLERAYASSTDTDDAIAGYDDRTTITKRLAFYSFDRFMTGSRIGDRDRAIELLSPLLDGGGSAVDGPLLACLGLSLADRSDDKAAATERRNADVVEAARLLQAAFDLGPEDAELREQVVFELARMRFRQHDCDAPDPDVAGLDGIVELLTPYTEEPGMIGAAAIDFCATLAHDLLDHDPGPAREGSAIAWFRRAVAHPAVREPELRGYRCDLAIALADRAARNGRDPAPGEPSPDRDWEEALRQLELALAALDASEAQPGTEEYDERLSILGAIFDALPHENPMTVPTPTLERLIEVGDEVMAAAMTEESSLRAERYLRLGIAYFARSQRNAAPDIIPATRALIAGQGAYGAPASLAEMAPGLGHDLDRAIDLLRTGTGMYGYDDEMYAMSAMALGSALAIRYLSRLPAGDRATLQESLRWQRIAYDRVDRILDEVGFRDFRNTLAICLMWDYNLSPPLSDARARGFRRDGEIPDLHGFADAENSLQLLGVLLDDMLADPATDSEFVWLAVLVAVQRDRTLPDDATCRAWFDRLDHALLHRTDLSSLERGWQQLCLGVLGMVLSARGKAEPSMVARSLAAFREARDTMPAESGILPVLDDALARGPAAFAADPADLTGVLVNGILSSARPPTPPPAPATTAPAAPASAPRVSEPVEDPLDLTSAALIGDGRPYPFTEPPWHVLEIVGAMDTAGSPVSATIAAIARHDRWRREQDVHDLAVAIELARGAAARWAPKRPALRDRVEALVAGMLLDRHHLAGDRADLESARELLAALTARTRPDAANTALAELLIRENVREGGPEMARLFALAAWDEAFHAELLATAGSAALLAAELDGRSAETVRATERAADLLRRAVALLPAGHPRIHGARAELGWVRLCQAEDAGDVTAAQRAVGDLMSAAADCPDDHPHLPAVLARAAAAAERADRLDPEWTKQLLLRLEATAKRPGSHHHAEAAKCRYALGHLLLARFGQGGNARDLDRAVTVLESARLTLASSAGDPFTAVLLRTLARAYRLGADDPGRRRRSRETGRSLLSAHGHAVLLQSGTWRGLSAARRADVDMLRLVRWCLADDRPAEALDALELGRGLVLQAATVAATVPELLRENGHEDLAVGWDPAGSGTSDEDAVPVPGDIRRRVLGALTGTWAERRLLSAPSPAEVGRALGTVGADALVYLIPGTADAGGHALIVRRDGTIEHVELGNLVRRPEDALELYVRALERRESRMRDLREAAGITDDDASPSVRDIAPKVKWRDELEGLCQWAGRAVMADLLGHARSWRLPHAPRLVLAPVGPLSVVPWHAAETAGSRPDARRYACQDAVFSYCATARQLIDAAGRPRLPRDGVQVLVVDPHGSPVMHEEAARIHDGFYPDATIVGGLGARSGMATDPLPPLAASVDPFLPGRGATSAAVFIANCHAVSGGRSADSRLVLDQRHSGDPDRLVTVDRLAAGAAFRDPKAPGGIFLFANCGSDLSLADRDEAMTITTAVLAAGAATVVGTRWAVTDDVRTMLLMYMLNHHLASGLVPADALHATQLWMLDPGRVAPPEVADVLARAAGEQLDDPRIWAAYTHHGH